MVDRYDVEPTIGEPSGMEKIDNGDYVLYEDYVKLQVERKQWAKKIKRLEKALEALKGLTHYHYTVCNIDDQSEDEIAEFIDHALQE